MTDHVFRRAWLGYIFVCLWVGHRWAYSNRTWDERDLFYCPQCGTIKTEGEPRA